MPDDEIRFNVRIPATLHRRFKAACATRGETMSDVVLRKMQEYIDESESEASKK